MEEYSAYWQSSVVCGYSMVVQREGVCAHVRMEAAEGYELSHSDGK